MNGVDGKHIGALLVSGVSALTMMAPMALADGSVRGIAPPAVYAPTTWQGRSEAVLRVMNRLDSHVEYITAPVGQETDFRTLSLHVASCLQRPQTLPADTAVQLSIEEKHSQEVPPFNGWMMASAPALGVYVSPLYDVQVVRCQGQDIAPQPGPLPQTQAPVLSVVASPHVDADNLHPGGSGASTPAAPSASSGPGQPGQGEGGGPMSLLPPPQAAAPSGGANGAPAPSSGSSGPMPLVPPATP